MSEDTVLKVGDTVSLKSGGHVMTVASIDERSVTCDWSVRGDVKSKSFPAEALKKAAEPAEPVTAEQVARSLLDIKSRGADPLAKTEECLSG